MMNTYLLKLYTVKKNGLNVKIRYVKCNFITKKPPLHRSFSKGFNKKRTLIEMIESFAANFFETTYW